MESIFIQIASYHDYELPLTILDALEKSSKNNLLNFGIHLSYYENDDIAIPDFNNIKYKKDKAPEGIGVGYGRYMANSFYDGEDYYFQIDSHTRFVKNWDEILINCYKKYLSEGCNPVITAYPSNYWYDDDCSTIIIDNPSPIQTIIFEKEKPDSIESKFIPQKASMNEQGNIFCRSVSGGSIFSSGSISEISPNKKMFYWGEELLTALRLFTHGYDLMLPEEQTIFHLYFNPINGARNFRRHAWNDFPEYSNILKNESNAELYNIINNKILGNQGLGIKRTIEQFEYYSQIKF